MKEKQSILLTGPADGGDPEYEKLFQSPEGLPFDPSEVRQHVEKLWYVFRSYADSKFPSQCKKDFHACYWEMLIANALKVHGQYELTSKDKGPDFYVNELNAWIECVTATNGENDSPDRVPDSNTLGPNDPATSVASQIPTEKILLRYTNAFESKRKKFEKYLEDKAVGCDQPCIVAINTAKMNYSEAEPGYPRILAALFPFGNQFVRVDKGTGETIDTGYCFKVAISKENGAKVPKTAFASDDCSQISGVIWSKIDVWKGFESESIGADLLFVPNPYARNPVLCNFLKIGRFCEISVTDTHYEFTIKTITR